MAGRLSQQEVDYFFVLRSQGKSLQVIADLTGRDKGTVARYLCPGCRGSYKHLIGECLA